MIVDIAEVKRHIKPKADSTLRNMRKDDLIEYIRCLEHNYNVSVSFNENQAKYIESLDAVPVVRCKDCWKNGTEECAMHIECDCGMYSWNEGDDFCSWGEREDKGKID